MFILVVIDFTFSISKTADKIRYLLDIQKVTQYFYSKRRTIDFNLN